VYVIILRDVNLTHTMISLRSLTLTQCVATGDTGVASGMIKLATHSNWLGTDSLLQWMRCVMIDKHLLGELTIIRYGRLDVTGRI